MSSPQRVTTPLGASSFVSDSTDQPVVLAFPYAGGGVTAYRGWRAPLRGRASLKVINLPGRDRRVAEDLVLDMPSMVRSVMGEIRPYLDHPFSFVGHSMGAILAFELARELRSLGLPQPEALIVAGCRSPRDNDGYWSPPRHEMPDSELLEDLAKLDGIPRQLHAHPELLQLMLPRLRADLQVVERYRYHSDEPLNCPIIALSGRSDPIASPPKMAGWEAEAGASFLHRDFSGGHFFVQEDCARVTDLVLSEISRMRDAASSFEGLG